MMLRLASLLVAVLAGASLAWFFTRFLKNWELARRLGGVTLLILFGWAMVELLTTGRGALPTIVLITMTLVTGRLRRSGGSSGDRAA
jgi:cytochrome c biogenesis protein CcdA